MSEPILIWKVSGGGVGDELLGCYFIKQGPDKYDFYDRDGNEKVKNIRIGSKFSFFLDEDPLTVWHLTLNSGTDTQASGNYKDHTLPSRSDDPDPTYQAQAQGTIEGEDSAASKTASSSS